MDATFWALVGLIIFFAVIAYFKVPAMIAKGLDGRADKIRNELEEARKLREEAEGVLAEYKRKSIEAEKEAENVVAAAKREADAIASEARAKTEEYVERRTQMAEQKIAQAETDAINAVRSTAVDVAVAATEKLLAEKMTAKSSGDLFKQSIAQVKSGLN
ncbi:MULTISPECIES: F0F1 ATP synthase subunit B [Ahrensia]|uniref:ATP synthase subunit b n=1 Tax=Ahrensia kielensis TaxID=76980 RepID=A0ABU9T7Q2_9HYPH|nr:MULTISPECIES: F0F1 ATP synthase subunit B [Ahrensia]